MNKNITVLLVALFVANGARGESLLSAQSFPKTFDDLSFVSRMEFKANDYELYRPIYDDQTGICIKNCVYDGITIIQEQAKSESDTIKAVEKSKQYEKDSGTTKPTKQKYTSPSVTHDTAIIVENVSQTKGTCLTRNSDVPVGQQVPWGEPVKAQPRISSPYGPRKLEGKQSFHDGIDYAVPVGTTVFAPADGRVVRIIDDSTCGKGVRLQHKDGTQTIYCHLSEVSVANGQNIGAGCPIALSGNTGHSTGPHLHYGMRDSSNNKIDPSEYTKRAK